MSRIFFAIQETSNIGLLIWISSSVMEACTNRRSFLSELVSSCQDPTNCGRWYVELASGYYS
jgi:hypothetical protein